MADTITVRDHGRPCEHGSLWPHWFEVRKGKWWQEPDCLGGRAMTLTRRGERMWEEVEERHDDTS